MQGLDRMAVLQGWLEVLTKQERLYNQKLERYKRMSEWCNSHTVEEQQGLESEIVKVIRECSEALNAIDRTLSREEIVNGIQEKE